MSDLMLERLVHQNNQQIIAKANRYHLIQDAGKNKDQPITLHHRFFYSLGERMIQLGHILKERHPVADHHPALG